jgi:uncharacterized lipoprotein YmbA
MKWLFFVVVLVLSACATSTTPLQYAPAPTNESRATPLTIISGDELKQTGRADLSDALRASSPIFH